MNHLDGSCASSYVASNPIGEKVMSKILSNLWNDESGISSVEYALLLAFVAAGIILAADQLSNAVSNEMEGAATCIESATPSPTC